MELTAEMLNQAKSRMGGYEKNQLALLGVSWPPEKGWKGRVEGRLFKSDVVKRFVSWFATASPKRQAKKPKAESGKQKCHKCGAKVKSLIRHLHSSPECCTISQLKRLKKGKKKKPRSKPKRQTEVKILLRCPECGSSCVKLTRHLKRSHGFGHQEAMAISAELKSSANEIMRVATLPKQTNRLMERGTSYAARATVLKHMGYKSYETYLKGKLWRDIRKRRLAIDDNQCQVCTGYADQVHHRRYDLRTMQGKTLAHLISICGDCHQTIEFKDGKKVSVSEAEKALRQEMRFHAPAWQW